MALKLPPPNTSPPTSWRFQRTSPQSFNATRRLKYLFANALLESCRRYGQRFDRHQAHPSENSRAKSLNTRSVNNVLFEILPRDKDHRVTACWDIQHDWELINFMPHMHVRGKINALRTDLSGRAAQDFAIRTRASFHWQLLCTFKQPLPVPPGSRMIVTSYFDNSEQNLHNPDPSKTIRRDSATTDEMMIGCVNYVTPGPGAAVVAKVYVSIYDA